MIDLPVSSYDERIVCQLKIQAARHDRYAEAERRAILAAALLKTRRRSLAAVLAHMPDVGCDLDFERHDDWLLAILAQFNDWILDVDADIAQVWGALRRPHPENALDNPIAATTLVHGLCVVTRNIRDFQPTGAGACNPFSD